MPGCSPTAKSTTHLTLMEAALKVFAGTRTGKNGPHALVGLLQKAVFGHVGRRRRRHPVNIG
jgi:hypothetical protein